MASNTDEKKPADASEGRQAQDREAHLQQMLVDTLESISDAFFSLDDELVVTYWNRAAEHYLGRTADEVIGKPLFEAFPEARGSIFETNYREAVRTRRPLIFETYFEVPPYQNWYEVRVYPRPNGISVYFLVTTERKRAELALRESEERLRLISEAIPGVLYQFRLAPDGSVDFPYISRGVYDIFGVNAQAVMRDGQVLMGLIHEADRATVEATIADSARKMIPYHLEHRIHRPDGEIRWIKAGSIPKPEEDGGVLWNGVIIDITDRKAAEERLRESEARNTALIRNIHAAVVVHDPDTGITAVNPQALDLLGLTEDQALGRVSRDPNWAFLRTDGERMEPESYPANQVMTHGAPLRDMIVGVNRPDRGDVVWVLVNADPVLNADGDIHQVIVTFVDITERKRAEEALEKRILALTMPMEESKPVHFEDLFNIGDIQRLQDEFAGATGVASIITDTEGVPITQPSNFCRLCREIIRRTDKGRANCFKSDARIGRFRMDGPTIQPCLSGGLWDAGAAISVGGRHIANWLIGQVRDDTQSEAKIREYAREIDADEETAVSAFQEVPAMSRERFGRVAQALFTLADQLSSTAYQNVQQARFITERKRAEEERARLEERFHQSQKLESIGRLAGGVAHDLNNLLSPILGYSEMLLADAVGMDPRRDSLTAIVTAGQRARDLVRQLLAFGRKQTLKVEPVDLNILLKHFHRLLRRTIREDIVIHMDLARALPPIQGDAGQLEQVVMNLAVNAQDAMPDGGELTIETSAAVLDEAYAARHEGVTPGSYVMLAVSDTGCGMDAETREHIFEPFFTTKEKHKGTGLGLATIYGIVKQHAGHIWIYSEPGAGSTFKIYLPVAGREVSAKSEAARTQPAADPGGSETILVVEDNQQVRELTNTILEREGYRVLSAHSGESALVELNRHQGPVHLLLTDVVMPDMNGRELFDKISATHPHMKVLYMSGYTDNVIAHRGVLDADIGFIQKPFVVTGLAAKVREVLT
ncbi:MAG: PocR ligand-binding domain-containing protein [Desulfococcaceae bacterium]